MINRTLRLLYPGLVVLLVILDPRTTCAQIPLFTQHQLDSMENLLKTADKSAQIDLSIKLAAGYIRTSHDRALDFGFKGLQLARAVDSTKFTYAYGTLAIIYTHTFNYDSAKFYYSKAYKTWPISNDTLFLAELNNSFVAHLIDVNDLAGAFTILHQNLDLLEMKKAKRAMEAKAMTLSALGSLCFYLDRYQDALHFDSLSIDIASRNGDIVRRNKYLVNLASTLTELGELDKALPILEEMSQYFSESGQDYVANNCYALLAHIYDEQGDTTHLKEALENAVRLSYKVADWDVWQHAVLHLAEVALGQQNYQKASELVDQVLDKPDLIEGNWEVQHYLNHVRMKRSFIHGDIAAAERYERAAQIAQDSMKRETYREKVKNLEVRYAVEKKEKENELLRKDRQIKDAIIKRQNILVNAGYAGASLLAGLIITLFITAQRKKKGNMLLESKNDEIVRQSREIEERSRQIEKRKQELEATLKRLTETQNYVVQSEKLTSLGQFAAGIAQEIGAPIGLVTEGIVNLKQEVHKLKDAIRYNGGSAVDTVVGDIHALTRQIASAASRTAFVVKNLMKVTSGFDGEPAPANLNDCLSASATVATTDQPMITVAYDLDELPKIHVALTQMSQAFLNIMRNGVQAMALTGGVLRIKTQRLNEKYVGIWIIDTGRGIAPEILPRVFDPFFTTREAGQGAGLGLAIAHSIVTKHRGIISIESEYGKGTSVFIKLPVFQE